MIYEWKSQFNKTKMMQERALTSFAIYYVSHTNTAHEQ